MRQESRMLSVAKLQSILQDVHFPGYTLSVGGGDTERLWLQGSFQAHCSKTSNVETQFTRKWYVSWEATKSEVVQTALKLVLTSVEHEAREAFRYRGRPVFGPHCNVDILWELCGAEGLEEQRA